MRQAQSTGSARFAFRLYTSLIVSIACIEMCATSRVTKSSLQRINEYAIPV